ncbi:MAG: tetratricopeptide repeat protein, partial [Pseudomonadota bacterium]
MRLTIVAAIVTLTATPAFATCPPWDGQPERFAQLSAQIKEAPDQATGQALSQAMWNIWAKAPDDKAQELIVRGQSARESYDYDAAIDAFDALVAYCPDYAEGYNQRAFIYFLRQDFEPALADLELALERNPEHIAARAGLALTLLNMGRFETGQAVLREALEMNPWLPERGLLV